MPLNKTNLAKRERAAKKKIRRKFGDNKYRLQAFREDGEGLFCFELESLRLSGGVTFSEMADVSEIFGTKNIDVNAWYVDSGCPTCGGSTEYSLEVRGARVS